MITLGRITLDPDRLIPAGDHRYRIESTRINPGGVYIQIWVCTRCGIRRRPTQPHVDCPAGPVTP